MNESDRDFERENEKQKEGLEKQKRAYLKIIDMIKAQKETEASENSSIKRVNGELEDENRKLKQTIIGLDEVVAEKNLENLKLKGELEEANELMSLLSDEVDRLHSVSEQIYLISKEREGKGCTLRDKEIQRVIERIIAGDNDSEVARKVGVARSSVAKIRKGTYGIKAKRKVTRNINVLIKKSQDYAYIEKLEALKAIQNAGN